MIKTLLSVVTALLLSFSLSAQQNEPCPGCASTTKVLHVNDLTPPPQPWINTFEDTIPLGGATTQVSSDFFDDMGNLVSVKIDFTNNGNSGSCHLLETPYGGFSCEPKAGCMIDLAGTVSLTASSGSWGITGVDGEALPNSRDPYDYDPRDNPPGWVNPRYVDLTVDGMDFSSFEPFVECGDLFEFVITVDIADASFPVQQTRKFSFVVSMDCAGCSQDETAKFGGMSYGMERAKLWYQEPTPISVSETGLDLRFV